MTRGVTFLRMYPSDWRSGCLGLTLEQEGLYIRMCMFMAEVGRRVPMDDSQAAKMLGTNINQYRKVLGDLLRLGKIRRHDDGYGNDRAEHEISAAKGASDRSSTQGKNGSDREADQDENGPTPPVTPQVTRGVTPPVQAENHQQNQSPSIEPIANSRKDTPLPPKRGDDPVELYEAILANSPAKLETQSPSKAECLQAFADYNATALRCGLPQASRMTPDRERKIRARLKDYGPEGWSRALANVERSKFLTGGNDRGWRANLDFLLQPTSFAKVHDGVHGNAKPAPAASYMPKRQTFVDYDEENRRVAEMARKLVDQAVAGVTP